MEGLKFSLPMEIEAESFAIIGRELDAMGVMLPEDRAPVIQRCIHATADFDYAGTMVFTPGAVERGAEALGRGTVLVTDTNMARAGLNRGALARLQIRAECFMALPEIAALAKERGMTRAAASMDWAAERCPQAVYAVGNAPTALLRLEELIRADRLRPALIVAVPVGFVNVVESKERIMALARERKIPAIAAMGRKGGSTVAAAICNALLYLAGGR